jgi:hypothetical protein
MRVHVVVLSLLMSSAVLAQQRSAPEIFDSSIQVTIRGGHGENRTPVFAPQLRFSIEGKAKEDDGVFLQYSQAGKPLGKQLQCEVDLLPESDFGMVACGAKPEDVRFPGPGTYRGELTYRIAPDATDVKWRELVIEVNDYWEDRNTRGLYVNQDRRLAEGWVSFPGGKDYPHYPTMKLHWFMAPKENKAGKATVRCSVNGKPIDDVFPSILETGPGSWSGKDERSGKFIGYAEYWVHTPFIAEPVNWPEYGKKSDRYKPTPMWVKSNPGDWECKVSLDGEPVRVFRFKIDNKGDVVKHPEQEGSGAIVSERYFVDTEILGEQDRPEAKARIGGTSFFGRPWKTEKLAKTSAPLEPDAAPTGKPWAPTSDRALKVMLRFSTGKVAGWVSKDGKVAKIYKGLKISAPKVKGEGDAKVVCTVDEEVEVDLKGKAGKVVTADAPATCTTPGDYTLPKGSLTDFYSAKPNFIDSVTNPAPAKEE